MLTSYVQRWLNTKAYLCTFECKTKREGRTERYVKRECSKLEGTKWSGNHKEN